MNCNVTVVQPSIPTYRLDFFDRLSEALGDRFAVHASPGRLGVLTAVRPLRTWERRIAPIIRLLPGVHWQRGALGIPIHSRDIVVVSGGPRCLSNLAVLLKARLRGAKTVWWGHYWSSTSRPWRLSLRLFLMRQSDVLLFYTDKEVHEYRLHALRRSQPAYALNNGIALDDIQLYRLPYRALDRRRSLLFIGRLTKKTELALLLRALADPILEDVYLEVIGTGDCEAVLKTEAKALGLQLRIRWHGATTDEMRIAEVANRCALFVYPGSVGLSLIHAMAYGLPAILHNDRYRHMPEIAAFETGVTGLSFVCGDSADLATKISEALNDHGQLECWAKAAQERVDRFYNTAAMAERFLEMLRTIQRTEKRQG
jgi:glycosyltransferase involved in cell wall biosynthesis